MEIKIDKDGSLAEHFINSALKNWDRHCISDFTGKKLTYGQTFAAAEVLSKKIDELTIGQDRIGILLPPSIGGAVVNIAVGLLSKVSVNLNYIAGNAAIESAVKQSGIKTVLTSKAFLEKFENIGKIENAVFLEDIRNKIGAADTIASFVKCRFNTSGIIEKSLILRKDDLATIIFSSGSSGEPKGVMLSHKNILSNIDSLFKIFNFTERDNLCAVLPFFHSFGFTCALWLPVIAGVSAAYCPNPIDGKAVGQIARENKSSVLFAAPTFLLNYIRKAEKEDFANLRVVATGAEKLRKPIVDAFEEKFGIKPLEGYGATELSPVVSLNLPDSLSKGHYKTGHKEGTVGLAVPGVEIKITDVDTAAALGANKCGLICVRGDNVMKGYLDKPQQTAEAIVDGWYNTGDIGFLDEEGFLTVTDRIHRFSKIGGEMVSHLCVEEVIMKELGADERLVAVTSIPQEKKGEELVVFYLEKAGEANKLFDIISKSSLPNISKPKRENFIKIETLPTLGSGKLDIRRLREIAILKKTKNE